MTPKQKKSKAPSVTVMGGSNTITSLPPAPVDERHGRMVRYSVSMGIRMACIIIIFFVPGWWRLLPAIAAVVLPYIAVVLANAGHDGTPGEVERPGGVELYRPPAAQADGGPYRFDQDPAPSAGEPQPRRATYTADGYVAPKRAAPSGGSPNASSPNTGAGAGGARNAGSANYGTSDGATPPPGDSAGPDDR